MQLQTERDLQETKPKMQYLGVMGVMDELDRMKAYLRWRIEEWLRQGGQAKTLAEKAGMSEGWMSSIRAGESIGEKKWSALIDALGLTLEQALAASREWAATQRALGRVIEEKPQLPESDNLRRAIEMFGAVTPAVREKAAATLAQFGDREVDQWMSWIRNVRESDAAGSLLRKSRLDHALITAGKPTRPTASARMRTVKKVSR